MISNLKSKFQVREGLTTVLLFILIYASSLMLFWDCLHGGFMFDDWGDFGWVMNWPDGYFFNFLKNYSPLSGDIYTTTTLVWRVEYLLFGFNHFHHHLGQLGIHFFNMFLIYIFARKIEVSRFASLFAVFFFGCSSAYITTVAWWSAGIDLPLVTFGIPSILFYIKAKEAKKRIAIILWYLLSLLFFLMALKTKLMGLSILAAIFCYEIIIGQNTYSWQSIKNKTLVYFKWASVFIMIALIHVYKRHVTAGGIGTTGEYAVSLSPLNYLNSVGWYLNQILLSLHTSVWVVSLVWMLLLAFAIKYKNKIMIFGSLWFFLCLFPVAILKIHHYPHHLYFPAVGFYIFLGQTFYSIIAWIRLKKIRLANPATVVVVIGYIMLVRPDFRAYANDSNKGWAKTQATLASLKEVVPILPDIPVEFIVHPRPAAALFDFPQTAQIAYSKFKDIETTVIDNEDEFKVKLSEVKTIKNKKIYFLKYNPENGLLSMVGEN